MLPIPAASFSGARKNSKVRKGAKASDVSVGRAATGNHIKVKCLSLGPVLPCVRSSVGRGGGLYPGHCGQGVSGLQATGSGKLGGALLKSQSHRQWEGASRVCSDISGCLRGAQVNRVGKAGHRKRGGSCLPSTYFPVSWLLSQL